MTWTRAKNIDRQSEESFGDCYGRVITTSEPQYDLLLLSSPEHAEVDNLMTKHHQTPTW